MKAHLQAQEEVLKKLMQSQQQLQIKELDAFFEKQVFITHYNTRECIQYLDLDKGLLRCFYESILNIFGLCYKYK